MKCFYHPDLEAVALCKSCNRALCMECVADVPPGVACKGRCEADVAALNLMIELGKTAYQKTGAAHYRNAVAMSLVGMFFLVIGSIIYFLSDLHAAVLIIPLGMIFLLWSFFSYQSGKQINLSEKRNFPRKLSKESQDR